MRKIIFILLCSVPVICLETSAQSVDSALSFFPSQAGNKWIYDYRPGWHINGHIYYYSVEVIGDTMLSSGKTYKQFLNKNWLYGNITTSLYRLDSTTAKLYSPRTDSTEECVDSLTSGQFFPDTVLGLPTTSRYFSFYVGSSTKYSYGFGITYRWEEISGFPYKTILIYAKINGSEFGTPLAVRDYDPSPHRFSLHQNYPNPFNPSTTLSFSLDQEADITITVFNVLGQEVAQVLKDRLTAGDHTIDFDGTSLPSGVYFYQLRGKDVVVTKQMLLLK